MKQPDTTTPAEPVTGRAEKDALDVEIAKAKKEALELLLAHQRPKATRPP